ncbi:hypothetical protein AAGS40_30255 (plasmid) [Paraburkholderia sp. PREW-6R]|uniref:hypothetical protein n=1 Tax=Paraburkholderia sp. PREW-6R TaxID=3141544 RepID=UPI0031F4A181
MTDSKAAKRVAVMRVDHALPMALWTRVRNCMAKHGGIPGRDAARCRAATALLLLMGDTGLRIAEAAAATRGAPQWRPADDGVPATWWLQVVGKGLRERFVPLSEDTLAALSPH